MSDQPEEPVVEEPAAEEPAAEEPAAEEPVVEEPVVEEPVVEEPVVEEPAAEEPAAEEPMVEEPAAEEPVVEEPVVEEPVVEEPVVEEPVVEEPVVEEPAADDVAAAPAEPAPRMPARSRLAAAMRPKATRGQALAALLCAGLGFGLVVQVQSNRSGDLDRLRQSDLVRLLTDVNGQAERLAGEEQEVRAAAENLRNQESRGQVAEAQARERLQVLGILSGTTEATGPGIELRIDDPTGQVGAPILLDALQELRDAGAEAVQIGTVRVVASTAFVDTESGVQVDLTPLRPPYTYLVIGDPETLDAAMRIPGGVLDVLEQKEATGTVTQRDSVVVDALHDVLPPQYARPAAEAGS